MGLPSIGPLELIIVLAIALLIVGPGRLPEMGNAVGRTIREFRKASSDVTDVTKLEPEAEVAKEASTPAVAATSEAIAVTPVAAPAAATATVSAETATVPAEDAAATTDAPAEETKADPAEQA